MITIGFKLSHKKITVIKKIFFYQFSIGNVYLFRFSSFAYISLFFYDIF